MKKRVFSLFTSLIMVISLVGIMPAMSVGAETSGDYEYTVLSDGTVEITKYNGSAKELEIPSEIDGMAVTSINNDTFWSNFILKRVKIPSSVKNIDDAFSSCTGLERIDVDTDNMYYTSKDGVLFNKDKTILMKFPAANPMEDYIVPNSVSTIGAHAFEWCSRLLSVTTPKSLVNIGDCAFSLCYSLERIAFSDNILTVGKDSFYECQNLKSVYYSGPEEDLDTINTIWYIAHLLGDDVHFYCNYIPIYEYTPKGTIYHQTRIVDEEPSLRFVAELDEEDILNADSGSYTIGVNNDSFTNDIKKIYKSIYVNGNKVNAPEGKYYVVTSQIAGYETGDTISAEFDLSNYDYGLKKEIVI